MGNNPVFVVADWCVGNMMMMKINYSFLTSVRR